ncbi:MAG: hypothetical protein IBX43_04145 [Campylobacterales bacterium]|nr:hypothetical protein [Campylobacterales bacterium]
MELKDVILSTLKELEHPKEPENRQTLHKENRTPNISFGQASQEALDSTHNEAIFLKNMKERIHVLFEGFQSPNNANIEAKVDLTLNFFEYLLSSIETRLNELKESK